MSGFRENEAKNQKSAWYIFLPLFVPYFMKKIRKIVGAVSEINRPERTDERTNGGDFIDPFGFQPGTKKTVIFYI